MRVFILAAGLGTRMRAMFPDTPKALILFGGKPFIAIQLEYLIGQGFKDFVICVGYRSVQIREYCGDGSRWGITIQYSSVEYADDLSEDPFGNGHTLKNARPLFEKTSLVLNGDTYLPIDYQHLVERHTMHHAQYGALGTMALSLMPEHNDSGRVVVDATGRVSGFFEKQKESAGTGLVNAGAYVLEPGVLDLIPEGVSSIEHDLFPLLVKEGKLFGTDLGESFIDIGTPEGYAAMKSFVA